MPSLATWHLTRDPCKSENGTSNILVADVQQPDFFKKHIDMPTSIHCMSFTDRKMQFTA